MELNTIHNENCFDTMSRMANGESKTDVILTSPPYNTNKKAGKNRTLLNTSHSYEEFVVVRYDTHVDNMTHDEYCAFTKRLFDGFDTILSKDGVVLYNLSYGAENTEDCFRAVNEIITNTNFTLADCIIWKKKSALPNNCSKNKLTRITEFVFVFCRKSEFMTFNCNKQITSYRKTGQASYENIFNYIEAKNNDGTCPYNKATYSSELCEKLLSIYAPPQSVVYDPFMGTGTTAVACKKMGLSYIGSEISPNQCEWANDRLNNIKD